MYQVINDDGDNLSDEFYETKNDAKEFIMWHFRCLKRDGFLEGDTFNDFKKECYIIKKHRSK